MFLGLVLHKVLWEVLKRRSTASKSPPRSSQNTPIRLLKLGKILVLFFLVIQTLFLNILPISSNPSLLRFLGFTIFLIGLAIAIVGRLQLGDNWVDLEDRQVLPGQMVVSTGIYRYIRHPIYTGDLLLLFGLELALNSWLILAVVALIPIVAKQAIEEEAILSKELPGYTDYCKYSKRFIPFVI